MTLEDVQQLLNALMNLNCWHVGVGEATGSSIHLALGAKVRRRVPLRSLPQNDEYREYQGEASILVWCTWRLDSVVAPIASSDLSPNALSLALGVLIGKRVLEVAVLAPAADLWIKLSDGLELRVFCDHIPGNPSFDGNWQVRVRDVIVAAGPGYHWRTSHGEAG